MIFESGEAAALVILGIAIGMMIYRMAEAIADIIQNRNGGNK